METAGLQFGIERRRAPKTRHGLHSVAAALEPCDETALPKLIHPGNSIAQPDVSVVCREGKKCLLKDYSPRPLFVRLLLGRPLLRHEYNILRSLEDVEGVPDAVEMESPDKMVMEYIDGPGPLGDASETPPEMCPSVDFFDELKSVVEQMHSRCISHMDIRRRNVLRRADGRPYLVDFATAFNWGKVPRVFGDRLLRAIGRCDTIAVLKMQRSFHPGSLTPAETGLLDHPPWYLSTGRFLRKRVYRRFVKQRTWRRRLAAFRERLRSGTDA